MKQLTKKAILGLMMAVALGLLGGCASEEAKEPEVSTPPTVAETTEPETEEKVTEEEEVITTPVENTDAEAEEEISEPSADAEPVVEESKATITVKEAVIPYVGISEEAFEQKTGIEVDARDEMQWVMVPELGVEASFFYTDWDETVFVCLRGKISDFLEGVTGELTLNELVDGLSEKPDDVTYVIGTDQNVSIRINVDGTKVLDLGLGVKYNEMISADSPATLGER